MSILLGVNIDHIATLRQARYADSSSILEKEPSPLQAAQVAQRGGADSITIHIREDRRHMQIEDAKLIRQKIKLPLNLEMANTKEMRDFALSLRPNYVCIVPENRQEITTEGGLDVCSHQESLIKTVQILQAEKIQVSLFIDPDIKQVKASFKTGVLAVELHTGDYSHCQDKECFQFEYQRLEEIAEFAHKQGLIVNAGHGINYENVSQILKIPHLNELNIGHSIVSRSLFVGMQEAVKEMHQLLQK